jgi:hypothetical protein
MNRDEAQARVVQMLMDKVREDPYPSATQMSILEEMLTPELAADYVELLVEKAAEENFPSIPMLRRIGRVAATLPRR